MIFQNFIYCHFFSLAQILRDFHSFNKESNSMESIAKKSKGRPIGTGNNNDTAFLVEVAIVKLQNPEISLTAAIKKIYSIKNPVVTSLESAIRRWQRKWRASEKIYLEKARIRLLAIGNSKPKPIEQVSPEFACASQKARELIKGFMERTMEARMRTINPLNGFHAGLQGSSAFQLAREHALKRINLHQVNSAASLVRELELREQEEETLNNLLSSTNFRP